MDPIKLKLRMTKEDQEFFADAILNPAAPAPALVAAFRRRAEILNKVADGVEDMLAGRTIPHDVVMDKITEALNDHGPRTVIRTDEDLANLGEAMGIDPATIDDETDNLLEEYLEDPSPVLNLSSPEDLERFKAMLAESQSERLKQARLLGISGENEARLRSKLTTYRRALEKISSCESNYPGDVVDIARRAINGTDA